MLISANHQHATHCACGSTSTTIYRYYPILLMYTGYRCALVWYNLDRHGALDERTLHAGEPVVGGDKWGMNIWLRERAREIGPSAVVAARIVYVANDEATCSHHNNNGQLVRVTLTTRPGSNPVRASGAMSNGGPNRVAGGLGLSPCPACGEPVGPLGLCLCKSNYTSKYYVAPLVAPPASPSDEYTAVVYTERADIMY